MWWRCYVGGYLFSKLVNPRFGCKVGGGDVHVRALVSPTVTKTKTTQLASLITPACFNVGHCAHAPPLPSRRYILETMNRNRVFNSANIAFWALRSWKETCEEYDVFQALYSWKYAAQARCASGTTRVNPHCPSRRAHVQQSKQQPCTV